MATKKTLKPERVALERLYPDSVDYDLLEDMELIRAICGEIMRLRSAAKVSLQYPLAQAWLPYSVLDMKSDDPFGLWELVKEDCNVKELHLWPDTDKIVLDTYLSPDLLLEGDLRHFSRDLAQARKVSGFEREAHVEIQTPLENYEPLASWQKSLAGVYVINFTPEDIHWDFTSKLSDKEIKFNLTKV